jgi:hypothetical protein
MVAVSPKVNTTFIWPLRHINPSFIPSLTSSIKRASALRLPSSRLCLPAAALFAVFVLCLLPAPPAPLQPHSPEPFCAGDSPNLESADPRPPLLLCIACSLVADFCSVLARHVVPSLAVCRRPFTRGHRQSRQRLTRSAKRGCSPLPSRQYLPDRVVEVNIVHARLYHLPRSGHAENHTNALLLCYYKVEDNNFYCYLYSLRLIAYKSI